MATTYIELGLGSGSGGGGGGISPAVTGDRALVSDATGAIISASNVSTIELNYVDGVTSAIQTQLDAKPAVHPILTFSSNTDSQAATSSFAAIAGMTAQNVTVLAGTYQFCVISEFYCFPAAASGLQYEVYVDSATEVTCNARDTAGPATPQNRMRYTTQNITLSAGSHSFIPRWKCTAGNALVDTGYLIQVQLIRTA